MATVPGQSLSKSSSIVELGCVWVTKGGCGVCGALLLLSWLELCTAEKDTGDPSVSILAKSSKLVHEYGKGVGEYRGRASRVA